MSGSWPRCFGSIGVTGAIDIDQDAINLQRKRVFTGQSGQKTGQSGQKREIDISFELPIAGVSILILIECKR